MTRNIMPSELQPRENTYIHTSWLAKALAGDRQCKFSLWVQANYTIPKQNSDFDLEAYNSHYARLNVIRKITES